MFDEVYPEGAARCVRGHVLDVLQTKSLQVWPTLAHFFVREGLLICNEPDFDPSEIESHVSVYSGCSRCGRDGYGMGEWTEWHLRFADRQLVEAQPIANALPWGYESPEEAEAAAARDLRAFGVARVMVAMDLLLGAQS